MLACSCLLTVLFPGALCCVIEFGRPEGWKAGMRGEERRWEEEEEEEEEEGGVKTE